MYNCWKARKRTKRCRNSIGIKISYSSNVPPECVCLSASLKSCSCRKMVPAISRSVGLLPIAESPKSSLRLEITDSFIVHTIKVRIQFCHCLFHFIAQLLRKKHQLRSRTRIYFLVPEKKKKHQFRSVPEKNSSSDLVPEYIFRYQKKTISSYPYHKIISVQVNSKDTNQINHTPQKEI